MQNNNNSIISVLAHFTDIYIYSQPQNRNRQFVPSIFQQFRMSRQTLENLLIELTLNYNRRNFMTRWYTTEISRVELCIGIGSSFVRIQNITLDTLIDMLQNFYRAFYLGDMELAEEMISSFRNEATGSSRFANWINDLENNIYSPILQLRYHLTNYSQANDNIISDRERPIPKRSMRLKSKYLQLAIKTPSHERILLQLNKKIRQERGHISKINSLLRRSNSHDSFSNRNNYIKRIENLQKNHLKLLEKIERTARNSYLIRLDKTRGKKLHNKLRELSNALERL